MRSLQLFVRWNITRVLFAVILLMALNWISWAQTDYPVVDTGQDVCYDSTHAITPPQPGEPFYGQDAQFNGHQPSYTLIGDSLTVYDNVTGLTWIRKPDTNGDGDLDTYDQLTWLEFQAYPATLNTQNFGGYNDWRVPTIKELYSLIDFRGTDPSGPNPTQLSPFIDTTYFDFVYGDTSVGERLIDAQYWSNNVYTGTVFVNQIAVFGVNFADGRIKGYPRDMGPGGIAVHYARYVRGNTAYGINDFTDNGDGTITDNSTGLMWMKNDNGVGIFWENALSYAEGCEYAGYTDWRLPNAKELHSIVDYTRSPATTSSAAIDSVFNCTSITNEAGEPDYPFYWSGTTHSSLSPTNGAWAAYVSFGKAMGYMPQFGGWVDVHGAGAQRGDPKVGDPSSYPHGHGPQGDAVRIYNYVRCVRDAGTSHSGPVKHPDPYLNPKLALHPNPGNPATLISFYLYSSQYIDLSIYNILGQNIITLVRGLQPSGHYNYIWDASSMPSGMYIVSLVTPASITTEKLIIVK